MPFVYGVKSLIIPNLPQNSSETDSHLHLYFFIKIYVLNKKKQFLKFNFYRSFLTELFYPSPSPDKIKSHVRLSYIFF